MAKRYALVSLLVPINEAGLPSINPAEAVGRAALTSCDVVTEPECMEKADWDGLGVVMGRSFYRAVASGGLRKRES